MVARPEGRRYGGCAALVEVSNLTDDPRSLAPVARVSTRKAGARGALRAARTDDAAFRWREEIDGANAEIVREPNEAMHGEAL